MHLLIPLISTFFSSIKEIDLFACSYKRYFAIKGRSKILLILIFAGIKLSAQTNMHFSVSDQIMFSNASHLPFWLWANQDGRIDPRTSFLNLTSVSADGTSLLTGEKGFQISYGTSLAGGLEKESYAQINRLYLAMDLKGWKISAGKYYDNQVLAGLSMTNGNLARSRNYRPYPRIGLSTPDFKALPFFRKWLRFKVEYDEGILNDQRYVENTHLHHKAIYFKVIPWETLEVEAGLEHFVMWGGTSSDERIGKLPGNFKSYLRYITGAQGNDDFPEEDQLNVAGNQYGTYQILITKSWNSGHVSLYVSHPFEDFSGLNWRNYPDNLIGMHLHLDNQKALLSDFLYEFADTRQQGILDTAYVWDEAGEQWLSKHYDNYFNNVVYRSGATYHRMAMCSPLFAPVKVGNGISNGFGSNRFVSHHFGLKGTVTTGLYWKTLFSATSYLGTYSNVYEPEKNQLSGLFQLTCKSRKLPFDMMLSFAFDSGTLYENALGLQFGISKQW